jgi:chemotaxis protein histidine kinase CheA
LVAAMDGEIDLASSSKGTTFTIRIPCTARTTQRTRLGLVREADPHASNQ